MDKKSLGNKLRMLRKSAGMRQSDLEEKSGVSERLIQQIESGEANPGIDYISDLEGALRAPLIQVAGEPTKRAPELSELKAIVEDPRRFDSLYLANILTEQLSAAPAAMRALALRALFDRAELMEPYRDQLQSLATPDRKKRPK